MRLLPLAAAAVSLAMPAAAQERCAARQDFVDRLEDIYQETQRVVALMPNEMILELFATADGETWTLIQTRLSDGYACLIAAGEGVAFVEPGELM